MEPAAASGEQRRFQFERIGYFAKDETDAAPDLPAFNLTVSLRDGYKPNG